MNPFLIPSALTQCAIAQANDMPTWQGVRGAFQHTLPQPEGQPSALVSALTFVAGLLSVILILYVIARLWRRTDTRQKSLPPNVFFAKIAKQLGMAFTDRALLIRAAHASQLPQPAILLFSKPLLEKHLNAYADGLNPLFREAARNRIPAITAAAFPD